MDRHIPLLKDEEIRPDVLQRLKEKPPINIYRMLAHIPEVTGPFLDLIAGIYRTDFDARLREVALCRVGHKAGSIYEFHQHHLIALQARLSEREIEAIAIESTVDSLDDDGNLVCQAVDELEDSATLTPATHAKVMERFGAAGAVALIFIISTYCLVSRFANGCGLQLESSDPLAGVSNPN